MFTFKTFSVDDSITAMKVGTDGVLLGAWAAGGHRILDIGTGSGLIALMMAQRFSGATITALDIDGDACRQAENNVAASPFAERIEIICKALQEYAASTKEASFDAIVSNPPYFQKSLKSSNAKRTLARHTDTLSFRDLTACSKHLLKDGGTLSLIGPESAREDIEAEAIINGFTVRKLLCLRTKKGKPVSRFMVELVKGFATDYQEREEVLSNDSGGRSEWYHNLTKDFYIK